jgi:nitric oxide reductase subunit C
MTKRHTRLFFIGGTLLFTLVFLALTIDSHRQFGTLTNADELTDDVIEGKHVWHRNNCINCHTVFGEGAYYAPDLTKITQQRGKEYLTAFLRDPSQFYSEKKHRRLMPNPNLSDVEIAQVIAFLDWVSKVDNQGWPPRPLVVSSGSMAGATPEKPEIGPDAVSSQPVELGQALFRSPALACQACHSATPGVTLAGPSMAGVAGRAEQVIQEPTYKGTAKDPAGYLRESIVKPSAHLVPGANFSTGPNGVSLMPADYGTRLEAEQIDHLVAYLLTLR